MAYGARLESVLGASPRGFESPILRHMLGCVRPLVVSVPARADVMSQDFVRICVSGLRAHFYVSGLRAHCAACWASVANVAGAFRWPEVLADEGAGMVVELDLGAVPDGMDGLVRVSVADEELDGVEIDPS